MKDVIDPEQRWGEAVSRVAHNDRCSYHFYVWQLRKWQKRFRTICLFTHAASNISTDAYSIFCTYDIRYLSKMQPTFPWNLITGNLCTLVKSFLVSCVGCKSAAPQDDRACVRLACESVTIWFHPSEATWSYKTRLCLPDSAPPSAKWPVNKTYTPRSVCHIVRRTALSPAENRPNKGNTVKREAMTALSHSTPPLTRHKHQSLPAGSRSKQPLGCNLSQDRRRWHGS